MGLPSIDNATDVTAGVFPCVAGEGWRLIVVLKQVYEVELGGDVAAVPGAAIRHGDEPWGEDGTSSIRYPHDLAPTKACTDVLVVGDAMTPAGEPRSELPVRVEAGDVALSAQVVGPRTWVDMGHGVVPNAPLPFSRAPLRWEHAYGGLDDSDPARVLEEPRNPIGSGLVHDPRTLTGTMAPHVEDPAAPIRDHRSRPAPIGFGALGPRFEPRRTDAGTYDEEWTRRRMPMPPVDQRDAFHQVAPSALRSEGHLQGGEPVRLLGLHPRGVVAFDLPQRWLVVEGPSDAGTEELVAVLDTVILEPNDLRFELTWRASFPMPHRLLSRRNVVRVRALGDA